jgi:hypothetical protein
VTDRKVGGGRPFNAFDIRSVPVAVTVFPAEIYRAPRSWGERTFDNLICWNEVDKGGHFAAWDQPQLFSQEVRSCSPRKSGLRSGHCVDQRHEKQRRSS